MNQQIEVMDNSMLSQFKDCPRKFHWRYNRHLVPLHEKNYVTGFGHALHEAMAAWYKTGDAQKMDKAFVDEWLPYEGQDESGKRCMLRGLTITRQYREKFTHEPFEVITPDYIEVGFTMELGDHLICGKIDGIVNWKLLTEGLVVLEHKFSNSKGFLTCEPNAQLDTYIWAASRITGKPLIGAYFNQVYHTLKDHNKNDFVRELTYRSEEKIEEWERDTLFYIGLIDRCSMEETWPKNTKHCGAYNRACEYTRLCKTVCKTEQEELIPLLYKTEKWNPYPDARGETHEK